MKKAAIYTKTGDKGTTGLVSGTRIKKSDPRIHLYGEVDELNSQIGVGTALLDAGFSTDYLHEIQSALFDLGSNLACEKDKRDAIKLPQIKESFIEKMEEEIDKMDSTLPRLTSFILPGGELASAQFHVCRTVCRRVERQMVDFEEHFPGEVPERAFVFINRLSDYFFVLSRYINHVKNVAEITWKPSRS